MAVSEIDSTYLISAQELPPLELRLQPVCESEVAYGPGELRLGSKVWGIECVYTSIHHI